VIFAVSLVTLRTYDNLLIQDVPSDLKQNFVKEGHKFTFMSSPEGFMHNGRVAFVPLDSAHCTGLHLAGDEQTCAILYFEKQLSKRPGRSKILYLCFGSAATMM
jgi:hypothetical protein